MGQYLSVRYQLNESGKKKVGDDAFRDAGFNIETATISKRYFQFDYEPPHLENTENLTRNYGIETYLGYWLPCEALETMFEPSEFNKFRSELRNQMEIQINKIKESISIDLEYLKLENIIQVSDSNPIDAFQNKVDDLLKNELKLKRIFSKYEIFYLPYDINQKQEIEELFDEMVSLAESKTRKNTAMKAFLKSITTTSLSGFRKAVSENIKNANK